MHIKVRMNISAIVITATAIDKNRAMVTCWEKLLGMRRQTSLVLAM